MKRYFLSCVAKAFLIGMMVHGNAYAQGLAGQWNVMVPIYTNATMGNLMIDGARRAQGAAQSGKSYPVQQGSEFTSSSGNNFASADSWSVGTDVAISDQIREQYFNTVRQHYAANVAAHIMETYTKTPVRNAFLQAAGPYGLKDSDFRDVTTAYYVIGWLAANQAPNPTQAQVSSARTQIWSLLEANPLGLDARNRQIAAEQMMYEITSIAYARGEGEANRDRAGLARMASSTQAAFSKQGVDMMRLKLTNNGFEAR
jgi:hypothetical protein